MRGSFSTGVVLMAVVAAAGPLWAQAAGSTKSITNDNRLFQRFIEDGAVTEGGWFEGQFHFQSFEDAEAVGLMPIVAFNVAEDIEIGGRIALLSVNPDPGDSETGFGDLDIFGKIRLSTRPTQYSVGLLLKFPTGDQTKSTLHGTGEIDVAFFGAVRHDFRAISLVANGGLRINQDPEPDAVVPGLPQPGTAGSVEPEGEISLQAGAAMLFAITTKLSGVLEASVETERIDGVGSDFRLTLGAEYRASESFGMRFAAVGGAGDSAPNFGVIASAVLLF